ncbi:leucine rich repeat gene family protein-like protein [Glossina pallidipes salivary gland hypertrophy virus]|uniref:Leucine rich repeat gene family protein-like protein n=1 Tax=Glossina hytrovirus (isolate Glossina pallidipes/Ethiopia/Seibersdorf/-) TaxID=379529 RepID=A0A110AQ79_GHVS|nr:leucine rich repeat gene family protein-like protein [Glossina pallidipes salivary gland hypertrophy virus]
MSRSVVNDFKAERSHLYILKNMDKIKNENIEELNIIFVYNSCLKNMGVMDNITKLTMNFFEKDVFDWTNTFPNVKTLTLTGNHGTKLERILKLRHLDDLSIFNKINGNKQLLRSIFSRISSLSLIMEYDNDKLFKENLYMLKHLNRLCIYDWSCLDSSNFYIICRELSKFPNLSELSLSRFEHVKIALIVLQVNELIICDTMMVHECRFKLKIEKKYKVNLTIEMSNCSDEMFDYIHEINNNYVLAERFKNLRLLKIEENDKWRHLVNSALSHVTNFEIVNSKLMDINIDEFVMHLKNLTLLIIKNCHITKLLLTKIFEINVNMKILLHETVVNNCNYIENMYLTINTLSKVHVCNNN